MGYSLLESLSEFKPATAFLLLKAFFCLLRLPRRVGFLFVFESVLIVVAVVAVVVAVVANIIVNTTNTIITINSYCDAVYYLLRCVLL